MAPFLRAQYFYHEVYCKKYLSQRTLRAQRIKNKGRRQPFSPWLLFSVRNLFTMKIIVKNISRKGRRGRRDFLKLHIKLIINDVGGARPERPKGINAGRGS